MVSITILSIISVGILTSFVISIILQSGSSVPYTTWVEKEVTQCSNSWDDYEREWREKHFPPDNLGIPELVSARAVLLQSIRGFYNQEGLNILDVKIAERYKGNIYCEGCGCSAGWTVMLLVNNSDLSKMKELGFIVSIG